MNRRAVQGWAVVLMGVVHGCAGAHSGPEPATAFETPAPACTEFAAIPKELREPGSLLLFGEIHGTQELPSFFGEAVCTAATSGLPVEVGLELPETEQARFDSFLASPGGSSDVEALIAAPFWSRDFQDGRSSQAMVALLERLRRLRAPGLPIHVFPFDIDPGEDAADRDGKMASNLAAHARAHSEALTMVLVGEVHAWKTKGSPWDPGFLPMGWHLTEARLHVRSLGRSTPAGLAWVCSGGLPSDCGPGETRATQALPSGRTAGIELLPQPSPRGYDGLYGTPSLTTSPPALSSQSTHR